MATRQITIDDGSKKRKQVDLNLNPVALNPTVRAGGNYRVAVQQTPLTNSAMQLSSALKQGVAAYGQGVDIAQKKAAEDVAAMSDAEYDKFLQQGLDPEAKSLFGYTKTYNRKLAQKYYATEIPTKLQELSNDMFKNYYDYKDAASFEAALEERVGSVYDEADQLLGGNVFGEQANNALKSATRAEFLSNEVTKFSRELPARNKQLAIEEMNRNFADIDATNIDTFFSGATQIFNTEKGTLGNRAAAEALFTSVNNRVVGLIASKDSKDHDLAELILDEIGDGKGEDSMVANQELFATPERQLKLDVLEEKLEESRDRAVTDGDREASENIISITADAFRQKTEGDAMDFLDSTLAELEERKYKGEPITNDRTLDQMVIEIHKIKANPLLKRREHALTWMSQNQNQQDAVYESTVASLPERFLKPDPMGNGKSTLTDAGNLFMGEWAVKHDNLYEELYESVKDIEDDGERRRAFREGEIEVVKKLNEWTQGTTNSPAAVTLDAKATRLNENKEIVGPDEVARILAEHGEVNGLKVIEHIAEQQRQDSGDKNLTKDLGGKVVLEGTFNSTKLDNFDDVLKLKILNPEQTISVFNDAHEAAWGNFTIPLGFAGKIHNPSEIEKLAFKLMPKKLQRADNYDVASSQLTRKPKFEDKLIAGREMGELMKRIGIPSDVLVKGSIPITNNKLVDGSFSLDYLIENNFLTTTTVPILIDGDIQNTLTAVEAWKDNGGAVSDNIDANHLKTFNQIAEKFDLTVQELFSHQYLYLQDKGYLK